MAQNPLGATVAKNPSNQQTSMLLDSVGQLQTESGGTKSALNQAAAGVVKASPGRLRRVVVVAPGTAGNITISDVTTVAGAVAGNLVWTSLFSAVAAGSVIVLDWPMVAGIVISAISTGGIINVAYD